MIERMPTVFLKREGHSKRGLEATALENPPGSESAACWEKEWWRNSGSPWRSQKNE